MTLKWQALDEAVKQLRGILPSPARLAIRGHFEYEKAIQLGIEALERENQRRQELVELDMAKDIRLLPSETEEVL